MAWNEPGPNRDPWNQGPGGNKPGGDGGPPDLDEMLRRLKARFTGVGGPRGGKRIGPKLPNGAGPLVIVAVAVLWACTGFYVVDEQENGVITRFGKFERLAAPGMGWHAPWPVERVENVSMTRVRQIPDHQTMLTKDENIVDIELSVQYQVTDAAKFLFHVEDPEGTVKAAMRAALRETVGRSDMDFILTDGRDQIAERTKEILQQRLKDYGTGVTIMEVNLKGGQPPEAVRPAFEDAIKAREDQQRLKNEAEAYANDKLPKARGAAARQLAEAQGYREKVIAQAEGDAARFTKLVAEYRKAPQVTRDRLYLDSMSDVLSNSSKVLIDVDQGNPTFYLPLDQILKNAPRADAYSSDYPAAAGGTARSGSDPTRSRDRGRQ